MSVFFSWAAGNRWIWSAIGVVVLWGILSVFAESFSLQSLSGVLTSTAFLTMVAIGQMFVVSTGRGNIDLSIPSVVTFSAFVGMSIIQGSVAMVPAGLLAVVVIGAVVGSVNAFLVLRLGIPAIIATLATGYIMATAVLLANQHFSTFAVDPVLKTLTTGKLLGFPVITLVSLVIVAFAAWVLRTRAYGRSLMAVGQNLRAAGLAGVRTDRTIFLAFFTSSVLAAVTGVLLSAYVGGAFLEMGKPYLLQSVGAVVVGGTLIYGGSSTALGTFFGALLLVLIVTTMQIAGLPAGMQDIVQGAVIIGVLALAGDLKAAGRPRRRTTGKEAAGG
ncbi:ABC transporter permease [Arhodomonas aquaeolei]|uniref:ABC transporter permease n=1 Tax=Arhodomonas aquaeolei TaxID=2369 RepID=UPI00036C2A45|nr:ABC transporter permease [Arhodomonas aquaeolei]